MPSHTSSLPTPQHSSAYKATEANLAIYDADNQ